MTRLRIVDSHTEGEPTRVVLDDPGLPLAPMSERLAWLYDHDEFRTGVILEPRGSDVLVGALLLPSSTPEADIAVIFFNNGGYLGMCGHGTIGLVHTLAYLDRLPTGEIKIETPAGIVRAIRREDGRVSVANVPSYRYRKQAKVTLETGQEILGDVAYGGNWFFLCSDHRLDLATEPKARLLDFTTNILHRLAQEGITGADGALIDHVELFDKPTRPDADSKNFVLCPGLAYDRSPCGTGTSAKLACLAADEKLAPGTIWHQESTIGSLFEASYLPRDDGMIHPTITGRAYVTNEATLIFEDGDPFAAGIKA